MKRKIIWIIVLIIGIIIISIPIVSGIYYSIRSFSTSLLCMDSCTYEYGLEAFIDYFINF